MYNTLLLPENLLVSVVVFMFGTAFGSFATLASYRLPRGEDIIFKPSRCPACSHRLGVLDLFPILSWITRGRKCAYCDKKVSARYPLIEIASGILFLITYLKLGITSQSIVITLLSVCLLILIVTDLEHTIIPDSLQIAMLMLAVIYRLLPGTYDVTQLLIGPLAGLALGFLLRYLLWFWKKKEALGLGDVKFLAIVGIFLQKELIITFLFLAGVIGIFTALIWSAVDRGKQFPFGPALAGALYFCLIMPEIQDLVRRYITSMMLN